MKVVGFNEPTKMDIGELVSSPTMPQTNENPEEVDQKTTEGKIGSNELMVIERSLCDGEMRNEKMSYHASI